MCEGGNTANTAEMSQTNTAQTFRCAVSFSGLRLVQSFPRGPSDTATTLHFRRNRACPNTANTALPRDGNTARIVKHGYHAGPDVQPPRSVEEIYREAALCAGGVRESPSNTVAHCKKKTKRNPSPALPSPLVYVFTQTMAFADEGDSS